MTKTIVIGAGVMGASVAYRLTQAGAAVTVLEAARIGGGTSGISFAWTNAHKKPPEPYHDLNVAGMKAHAALADEFGARPWWHGGGSLEWEAEPDRTAQRENIEQLQSWGYAAEWIIRDVDRIGQSAKRHGLLQQIRWIARHRWGDLRGDYKVASAEFGFEPVAHPTLRLREMTKASSQNHKPPCSRSTSCVASR
jgi:glycine/D-amino acid oxidase-like deaminating enzyme